MFDFTGESRVLRSSDAKELVLFEESLFGIASICETGGDSARWVVLGGLASMRLMFVTLEVKTG